MIFRLFFGHFLADFAFQTDIMAKMKSRHNKPDWIPQGQKYVPTWHYWLTAHAFIHGGVLYLLTGNLLIGGLETILHWIIDLLKCENITNPHIDQMLHFLCKLAYIPILA